MYILYVDESGDPGFQSPTPHYVLSSFLVPAVHWYAVQQFLLDLRRKIKDRFGFPIRLELKGAALINPGRVSPETREHYRRIGKRNKRIALYRTYLTHLSNLTHFGVYTFSVYIDKEGVRSQYRYQQDVFQIAWERLLDRFNTFLRKRTPPEQGIIVSDMTDNRKARSILRRMRYYHPVSHSTFGPHNSPVTHIIEDPFLIDSQLSYFLQTADLIAHSVYRYFHPAHKRYKVDSLYSVLQPIYLTPVTKKRSDAIIEIP